jgi:hypothetical protein
LRIGTSRTDGEEPERGGDAPKSVGTEQPVERARVGTGAITGAP